MVHFVKTIICSSLLKNVLWCIDKEEKYFVSTILLYADVFTNERLHALRLDDKRTH